MVLLPARNTGLFVSYSGAGGGDAKWALLQLSRASTRWDETVPLAFQQVDGQETLAFRVDDQGQVSYLFQGNMPITGFRKLAW